VVDDALTQHANHRLQPHRTVVEAVALELSAQGDVGVGGHGALKSTRAAERG
jgi:hypothetical protein